MERRMVLRVLALTLAVGLVAGCGDSTPKVKTVAVSGTVYLDGSPLAGCSVSFNRSPDHAGIGQTDSSGKYELQAEPGENKVVFSKSKTTEGLTDEEAEMAEMDEMADTDADEGDDEPEEGQVIPLKYRDLDTTDQKFNVPEEGATNADFKLTTE